MYQFHIDMYKMYLRQAFDKTIQTFKDLEEVAAAAASYGADIAGLYVTKTLGMGYMFESQLKFILPKDAEAAGARIDGTVSTNYDASANVRPSSPITFDLDGDGIETLGMVRQYSTTPGAAFTPEGDPVMFDHNGDGVKVNTGWIGPDDGMLVYDRNGNGMIDNGTELFGDSTLLYSGGTAADGFAALAQEDTNADGIVNHLDASWGNLRIWRDLDSGGISDGGELFTLDELGITGINVNKTNTTQNLANGNRIIGTGTFTKADGTTGSMGDVWFQVDTFTSEFTDSIPVSEEVRSLPNMQGSGLVRDLQEAATQSPVLKNLLTQYSQATTRQAQIAIIDQLLYVWAGTSGMAENMESRDIEYEYIRRAA